MAPLISGHRGRRTTFLELQEQAATFHSILMVCRVLSCSAQFCKSCRSQRCSHEAFVMAGKLCLCAQLVLRSAN